MLMSSYEAPESGPEDAPSTIPEIMNNPPDPYEEPPAETDNDGFSDPADLDFEH